MFLGFPDPSFFCTDPDLDLDPDPDLSINKQTKFGKTFISTIL
jgi:hypothetical protein